MSKTKPQQGRSWSGPLMGAAFLMATSAIGPGFLTQTSLFTQDLLTSFGFVILISVLLDIGAQLNIWRIITVSNMRAQDMANRLVPGLGFILAGLIAFGGLVFNIGNIAGCGLGLNVLTGMDPQSGALISCLIALGIFWYKEAGRMVDNFTKILGLLMIVLTVYIVIKSDPPVGEALVRTFWPEKIDVLKIVTIVGGTVGGYISFAGAHRLLDAGISGKQNIPLVTKGSVSGIVITSLMRYILFLAALGVVTQGIILSPANPAATVFESAAGRIGYKFFGVVLWSAAITSVVGASYTSVSFWKTLVPSINKNEKIVISIFIIFSTMVFIIVGNPVRLLVLAGAVNGLILPIALAVMLLAVRKSFISSDYKHAFLLQVAGWLVVVIMSWMAAVILRNFF
ncbi:MAG TPA: NRAMP family divalent metal transporter [Chitinophagaceae bacterium]|nr:NRAMP family divalent metal transporter [Chitinophagaceae bacterium]